MMNKLFFRALSCLLYDSRYDADRFGYECLGCGIQRCRFFPPPLQPWIPAFWMF